MNGLTSGNAAVDQIGRMSIIGNVVPASWFKTIIADSGKPHYLAIMILSDIVYWYRPSEIRDERTGQLLGWRKKFHHDMLQRNYQEYAALMGESEKTVIRAIVQLEKLGVISRHRKTIELSGGMTVRNVLFLELIPERLYQLTFGENEEIDAVIPLRSAIHHDTDRTCQEKETEFVCELDKISCNGGQICPEQWTNLSGKEESYFQENKKNSQKNMGEHPEIAEFYVNSDRINLKKEQNFKENWTGFPEELDSFVRDAGQICPGQWTDSTATKTITAVSPSNTGNHQEKINVDPMDVTAAYVEIIKENVNYDFHREHDPYYTWEMFEELFGIICDVVCIKRKTIRINEEDYPFELVKSRYLKLKEEHITYVMDCMKKTNTPVRNIRSYMMTALYNAPDTICSYYEREAQHDLYG